MDSLSTSTHNEKSGSKSKGLLILWLFVIALGVVIMVATGVFMGSISVKLYNERQGHLQELTIKVSEALDTKVESTQEKAVSAKRLLEQYDSLADVNEILTVLSNTALYLNLEEARLLALDDKGHYYSSDYLQGRWANAEDLLDASGKPAIRELTFDGVKTTYVAFFGMLDKPVAINGGDFNITHCAVLVPLDSLKDVFTISGFDGYCYTYLVNSDGRLLYKQTFSHDFIDEYNVLTALEKGSFNMDGNIDKLKDSVKNREQLCLEFSIDTLGGEADGDYFVSSVPLSSSEWTVLMFVPTNILAADTTNFMKYVITYFAGLCLALVIVAGFLIYSASVNRSNRRLLEQQRETNKLLEKAALEANSANDAKTEFLSHMSHDIRTPINGIVGMTNIAIKNKDNPTKVADCLHKISSSADHLLTLVNDVLDMSRIESGKINIAHEPMDIRTMIDNCSSIIGGQILSRQLTFKKEFAPMTHPHVYGDELHTRQILINILGNAVKFTPDGGTIWFRVEEIPDSDTRSCYRFEVEDTGIGMSEAFLGKIFEPFSQEDDDNSRTVYKGTGLGMSITKQFVDLMGGEIKIRSKPNEGSCFTVELKLDINPNVKVEHEVVIGDNVAGMRILLVEDNLLNMEIAQEILEDEGVIVTPAENGQVAYDIFTKSAPGTFDVVLMDIMMPVMNGFDATKAIRDSDHPQAKVIPIVAMTANAFAEDVEASLEAGMNAHIAKPINVPMLLSVLNSYRDKGEI